MPLAPLLIGQAQQLLSTESVKKELDFNLERAKDSVIKAWKEVGSGGSCLPRHAPHNKPSCLELTANP